MFAKSSFIACVTIFASISAAASAVPSPLFGSCDNNGECSAVFNRSVSETQLLCGTKTASIAWRKNSAALLLQCTGSDTAEENRNYVVDGRNVIGLNYGRYVKTHFLQQNPEGAVQHQFVRQLTKKNCLQARLFYSTNGQANRVFHIAMTLHTYRP